MAKSILFDLKVSTLLGIIVTVVAMLAIYKAFTGYLFPTLSAKETANTNLLHSNPQSPEKASSIYDFSALDIDGNIVNLSKYNGLVTYIVNVASE